MTNYQNAGLPESGEPSADTLRTIYTAQWQDLHHSRDQDWRLANLVIVGFLGVGGLKVLGQFPDLQRISSLAFTVVSLLAVGVTERHRLLFKEKMCAIQELEKLLDAPPLFKPIVGWRKRFKVQHLLMMMYILFAAFFLCLAFAGSNAP